MKELVIKVKYNPEETNELFLQDYMSDVLSNSPDVIKYTMEVVETEDSKLGDN